VCGAKSRVKSVSTETKQVRAQSTKKEFNYSYLVTEKNYLLKNGVLNAEEYQKESQS
jgi:hypothetical protein